jgi:hypothetical protein
MVCGIKRIAHSHPYHLNPSLLPSKNTKGDIAYTSSLLVKSREKRGNHCHTKAIEVNLHVMETDNNKEAASGDYEGFNRNI